MREEQKLNKAIERNGVNTQSDILDELKRRYPQYVKQSEAKRASNKRRRIAIISSLAAAAVGVAIIVPCAVLLPNRGSEGNNEVDNDRHCTLSEYSKKNSEYTLREYSESLGGAILYFDWYDVAENLHTNCYISNIDNEVLCVEEYAYLVEPNEMVYLSVTRTNVYLNMFDSIIEDCNSERSVDNHTVKWTINLDEAACIFEDSGYRYFIRMPKGQDENRLFELTAKLLEKN